MPSHCACQNLSTYYRDYDYLLFGEYYQAAVWDGWYSDVTMFNLSTFILHASMINYQI